MAKRMYIGVPRQTTALLLHGDDFTESAQNLSVTNHSASIAEDAGAFGGKAFLFSGDSQYLTVANSINLPGDFTVEFRIFHSGNAQWAGILDTAGATTPNWTYSTGCLNISFYTDHLLFLGISRGSETNYAQMCSTQAIPTGVWTHVAVVRHNGTITVYLNGVASGSLSNSLTVQSDGTIMIGRHDMRGMYLNGMLDELRISSVARWTGGFTPPTGPYTVDTEGTGIARKVKKMYVGVEGIARKVKKGYIGVGGVARPFWSGGELAYYGTITPISEFYECESHAAASVGSYAIFGGGFERQPNDVVTLRNPTAYNNSLTKISVPALQIGRSAISSASSSNFAVFGGGNPYKSRDPRVDAYDSNLTHYSPDNLQTGRQYMLGTGFGNYALFGGGNTNSGTQTNAVDAYDNSLTRTIPTGLTFSTMYGCATSTESYAMFGGGTAGSYNDNSATTAYNSSLTRISSPALSERRNYVNAGSVGNYMLFAGGNYRYKSGGDPVSVSYDSVDAYDSSLTRSSAPKLSAPRVQSNWGYKSSATLGEYVLFAFSQGKIIEIYDKSLTKKMIDLTSSATSEQFIDATVAGDYALFATDYEMHVFSI